MDSTSRMPFFGLELRERTPKSSVPTFNSISRSVVDGARADAVVRPLAPAPKGSYAVSDGRIMAVHRSEAPRAAADPAAVGAVATSIRSVPFPDAMPQRATIARPKADQIVDFQ